MDTTAASLVGSLAVFVDGGASAAGAGAASWTFGFGGALVCTIIVALWGAPSHHSPWHLGGFFVGGGYPGKSICGASTPGAVG